MKLMLRCLILGLIVLSATNATAQTVRYVKPVASGTGDGLSWANANDNLQAMINASGNGDEVWVAAGTYKPTTGASRTIAFKMKDSVAIYGSFLGTESSVNQRVLNSVITATYLSGDLNGDDVVTGSGNTLNITNNSENSYRVIENRFTSGNPLSASAVLDGFIIKGGSNEITNLGGNYTTGGGIYNTEASPTLRNLIFRGNYGYGAGGGLANVSNSSPVLTNVTFDRNICQKLGGGMYNFVGCNPTLTNVDFTGNLAFDSEGGGGMYSAQNISTLTNCRFDGNVAPSGGAVTFWQAQHTIKACTFSNNESFQSSGAVYLVEGTLDVSNSVLYNNKAGLYGGAFGNFGGTLTVTNSTITGNASGTGNSTNFPPYTLSSVLVARGTAPSTSFINCIIWGNASLFEGSPGILRSIVQGGYTGTLVLNLDPQFVNATLPAGADGKFGTADDGLQLQSCSPALNAGESTGIFGTDLIGNPRIYNSVVDMGAYELQTTALPFVTVSPTTTNNALNFDGINDHVALINSCGTGTPIINGGDEITIEYWFRGSVLQSAVRLQTDGNNYIVSGHFGEHIMSNDGGAAPGSGIAVGAAATDGRWHHIAMTWKRASLNGFKSYLDGKLVAQRDASLNPLPVVNSGAYLGSLFGNQQMMNGSLEDVRIWNKALTLGQIQAGICDEPAVGEPGLVAWYTFNNGTPDSNNQFITPGIENKAQPGYYNGQLNGFALTGNSSNFINGPGKNVTRLYVKSTPTVPNGKYDGLSWQTAFPELREALNYPCTASNLEIWVAAGTYKPTADGNREAYFKMRNGVAIYGGFAGTETALNQRNISANTTILSGDLNGDDLTSGTGGNVSFTNNFENSYHVFYHNDFNAADKLNSTAILDGFTIKGGAANSTIENGVASGYGGGMYNLAASPSLRNLVFEGNETRSGGGGIYNGVDASPQLTNVVFSSNLSSSEGAGMYNFTNANVTLNQVQFINNRSLNGANGGVMGNFQNNFVLNKCVFQNNFAYRGGAIGLSNAQGTISQSSFINNEALNQGGAIANNSSTLQINNSTFAGNKVSFLGAVFFNGAGANISVVNSTFYNNRAGKPDEFNTPEVLASSISYSFDQPLTFTNCIIWGNASTFSNTQPIVTYSTVQGGYTGTGNISDYPRFFEPTNVLGVDGLAGTADDGLRLKGCSPALNAGTNTGVTAQDIVGNTRVFNTTVDMGAYELQETPSGALITLYQDADGDGFGNPNTTLIDCGTLAGWVTNNNDCNDGQANITTGPISDSSAFGNNVWNVHAWNAGGSSLSAGTAWNTGYAGFYVDNNLNFKTNEIWSINATPSTASNYSGCLINSLNFSYSAKRIGFPDGEYRLSVPNLFEAAELWINNAKVWSVEGLSGTNHGTVWTGFLDQNSKIDFRVTTSGSFGFSFSQLLFTRNTTKYVKTIATGTGDGSSWANATANLQGAINTSNDFSQIWVAAGTYNLTTSLIMKNGVSVYGGFAGTEALLSERNLSINTAVLTTNNTASVILNNENGVGSSAILDGFTIQGGNAERGGGIANYGASPTIRNCIFRNNTGGTRGAATSDERNSAPLYINCVFTNNSSPAGIFWAYGLIANQGSSPTFVNCTMSGNSGGNFFVFGGNSNITFRNCITWSNTSITPWNGFSGTITMTNSLVEGGFGGTGNINENPLFVSTTDFRLQNCSPAIDAGSDAQNTLTTDIASQSRKRDLRIGGNQIDMGAYELQTEPLGPVSVPPVTTNNALNFDGVDDHVALVNSCGTGAPIVNGGDEITIEYWFKGSVLQSAVRLQPDGNSYIVSGHNGEHIMSNDGGYTTGSGVPVGAAATDGNWHHVAMTWKRNTVNGFKSYLDGQLAGQRNSSNNPLPIVNSGAFLGALFGNLQMMTGTLDDVRIWNVARTASEIASGFCSLSLPQSGLVAWYAFDNGAASGNNVNVLPGVQNLAQPGYYNGLIKNFAYNDTASNWVAGYVQSITPAITTSPANISTCNSGNTSFTVVASNAGSYQWQVNTGSGFTNVPGNSPYSGITGATLSINPVNTAMNGNVYRCIISGGCSLSDTSNSASLNVASGNALSLALTSSAVSVTDIAAGNSIADADCGLVASVVPGGGTPVSGSLDAKIWIQAVQPSHNGNPYVRRHYELTPATNAANATAAITLYFTQADFDSFNNTPSHGLDLPTGPTDATGKLNIRIIKYGGQSNDGSGTPASYASAGMTITPLLQNIVWNSTKMYWEISFDVNGFSGFFLSSSGFILLPVNLQQVQAKSIQDQIQVYWTTSMEIGVHHFEIERSTNATRGFKFVHAVNAVGNANGSAYQFNDVNVLKNIRYYYRLKIVDADGTFRYAPIVSAKVNGNSAIVVYPNPVNAGDAIHVFQNNAFIQHWKLMNAAGQIVCKGNTAAGNLLISTAELQSGIYHLLIQTNEECYSYKVFVRGN